MADRGGPGKVGRALDAGQLEMQLIERSAAAVPLINALQTDTYTYRGKNRFEG